MRRDPVSVCILATPNTSPSTLFGLSDVLGSVGSAWETFVTGKTGQPLFDVKIVAEDRKNFRCAQSVIVSPECSIAEVDQTDIVIVASFVMPASETPGVQQQNCSRLDCEAIQFRCYFELCLYRSRTVGRDRITRWM